MGIELPWIGYWTWMDAMLVFRPWNPIGLRSGTLHLGHLNSIPLHFATQKSFKKKRVKIIYILALLSWAMSNTYIHPCPSDLSLRSRVRKERSWSSSDPMTYPVNIQWNQHIPLHILIWIYIYIYNLKSTVQVTSLLCWLNHVQPRFFF